MQPIYRNYVKICSVLGMSSLFPFFGAVSENNVMRTSPLSSSHLPPPAQNISALKVQGQAKVSRKFYCSE